MGKLRFPRAHRLKRRRLIRPLFDRRRSDVQTVAVGSVRLLYRMAPREDVGHDDVPLQIGFAPGRRARNAVERNRVRRILREVYRTHQHLLTSLLSACPEREDAPSKSVLTLMVLFRGDPSRVAEKVPHDLPEAMRRVAAHLRPAGDAPPRR